MTVDPFVGIWEQIGLAFGGDFLLYFFLWVALCMIIFWFFGNEFGIAFGGFTAIVIGGAFDVLWLMVIGIILVVYFMANVIIKKFG